jgi:hypothetical protein
MSLSDLFNALDAYLDCFRQRPVPNPHCKATPEEKRTWIANSNLLAGCADKLREELNKALQGKKDDADAWWRLVKEWRFRIEYENDQTWGAQAKRLLLATLDIRARVEATNTNIRATRKAVESGELDLKGHPIPEETKEELVIESDLDQCIQISDTAARSGVIRPLEQFGCWLRERFNGPAPPAQPLSKRACHVLLVMSKMGGRTELQVEIGKAAKRSERTVSRALQELRSAGLSATHSGGGEYLTTTGLTRAAQMSAA